MFWSFVQIVGKQATTFFVFLVLSMVLSPNDFGLLGMAMAWIAFIQVFSEIGLGAALIQKQDVTGGHFSTSFFVNLALGAVLTLAGIVFSVPASKFFETPEVRHVTAALSLNFLISSFSLTQVIIAQREMKFRALAVRDITASLIGGAAGVVMALLGYGVWSLVIQTLVTSLLGTVLIWKLSRWRPRYGEFSLAHAKDLWPYGSRIFMFNLFKYFAQNTDRLLIGYFLGSFALGLYTFAFKLAVYPFMVISAAIGNYLFPKFSREQHDMAAIGRSYVSILIKTSAAIVPALVLVIALSPYAVPFVWKGKWDGAIPVIQILTVLALLQFMISPAGQLMKALNRPGWLLNVSVLITVFVTIGIFAGVRWNISGVAAGITIAYAVVLPVIYFYLGKLVPLRIS